jgi:hypothetical protein
LGGLFGEVLGLCDRAGLVGLGVVAIDGTRIAGNASPEVNHECDRIAREILAEARATDEAEDELYGEARGDELPEQLRTPEGRREFFRQTGLRGEDEHGELSEEPKAEAETSGEVPLEVDAERIVARTQGREGWLRAGSASSSSIAGATRSSVGRGAGGCYWRPSGWRASLTSSVGPTRPTSKTGRPRATGSVGDWAGGRTRIGRRRCPPAR